jgi:hypothetical protein
VQHGVNVVLAPTHLLETAADGWRSVDLSFCEELRHELDQLGGRAIAIDYQLITTNALLRDEHQRRRLIAGVGDLPVENIWLRVSGFGASSTGVGTRHYIDAVRDLHELGRPLWQTAPGGLRCWQRSPLGRSGVFATVSVRKRVSKLISGNNPLPAGAARDAYTYLNLIDIFPRTG